jgi:hypothetical protein
MFRHSQSMPEHILSMLVTLIRLSIIDLSMIGLGTLFLRSYHGARLRHTDPLADNARVL